MRGNSETSSNLRLYSRAIGHQRYQFHRSLVWSNRKKLENDTRTEESLSKVSGVRLRCATDAEIEMTSAIYLIYS